MARVLKAPRSPRISISGFKSIRDHHEIELKPLTVLAGRNSSGKSSMMQFLLLLKQTLEAPFDPGPLRLDGDNVRFSAAEQLQWKGKSPRESVPMSIGFGGWPQCNMSLHFHIVGRGSHRHVALDHMEFEQDGKRKTLREGMSVEALRSQGIESKAPTARIALPTVELKVVRNRCSLEVHIQHEGQYTGTAMPSLPWFSPFQAIAQELARFIHVPGLRGNPERQYPATAPGPFFPGMFHLYTAAIIYSWQEKRDPRLSQLGEWLRRLELTWKVEARRVHDTQVELLVGRLPKQTRGGAKDLVSIADVGFGVSQVLPVLVALLVAGPEQIVYAEQPEIHLHPEAQVMLADCLLDAAKRGVLVVAETHSDLLLRGILTRVAESAELAPLVKLHWFSRDEEGASHVSSSDVSDRGAYGEWPEDLTKTEAEIDNRYLDASLRFSDV